MSFHHDISNEFYGLWLEEGRDLPGEATCWPLTLRPSRWRRGPCTINRAAIGAAHFGYSR